MIGSMRHFDSTCWSVVLGAAAGNTEARDRFARRYEPVVRSYLSTRWRVPERHERVSDGVQEVMLECLRPFGALERFEPARAGDFRGFLYGVTRRTAISIERRTRRDRRVAVGDDSKEQCDRRATTLSAAFDRTWAQVLCHQGLECLRERLGKHPDRLRREQCLEGRFFHNKPPRVIAEEMGVPVTEVYEILKAVKADYCVALVEVLKQYHPEASRKELEDKCRELAGHLG